MESILIQTKNAINTQLHKKSTPIIIAIDGRCASGKTTLASLLAEHYGCGVINMDHFFLRAEQRTEARLDEAGGNVDRERFMEQVLLPLSALKEGETLTFRPYDCSKNAFGDEITYKKGSVNIIEGSYCCHDALRSYYDLKIFLTVDEKTQEERLILREGTEKTEIFKKKWIPMEEKYFRELHIAEHCDLVIKN